MMEWEKPDPVKGERDLIFVYLPSETHLSFIYLPNPFLNYSRNSLSLSPYPFV